MKEFYKKIIFFLDLLVFYLYESSDFPNIILITRKKKKYFYKSLIKSIISLFKKKKNLIEFRPGSFKTVSKMTFFIKKAFISDNNFLFKKIILIDNFHKFSKSEKIRLKSFMNQNCASIRFVLFLKKSTSSIENVFSAFICVNFKNEKLLSRHKLKFKFNNFIKILNLYCTGHRICGDCNLEVLNQFFYFLYHITNDKFKKLIQLYKKLSNEFYFLIFEIILFYRKLSMYQIKKYIRLLTNRPFLKINQFIVVLLLELEKNKLKHNNT